MTDPPAPRRWVVVCVPEDEAAEALEHLRDGIAVHSIRLPPDLLASHRLRARFCNRLGAAIEAARRVGGRSRPT